MKFGSMNTVLEDVPLALPQRMGRQGMISTSHSSSFTLLTLVRCKQWDEQREEVSAA